MFFDKALRVSGICGIQNALAFFEQNGRLAMMDSRRREQSQRAVIMLVVVPINKRFDPSPGILQRTEEIREVGTVFHRLELRLRVRIVIRDARSRMSLGYAQIG